MSGQFAMILSRASTVPAGQGGDEAPGGAAEGLLSQVVAGPGFWEDLLGELRREGLIAELLADGVIATAVAEAEHGHKLDRALTAEVTAMCVITGVLFPDQGYDMILARTFGMPGVPVKPGAVTPSGPALSKARVLLGEQVMRKIFELDAARSDVELGIGATWHEMETTGLDGTTIELFSSGELADAFGVPAGGTKPKIRIAAHARTGSRRWIAAAVGGYHDGENTLADELEESFTAGIINLADRGFFSMDRWIRFSARGAHLAWRVKNGAKSVPFKTIETLTDGSELVLLRESDSMLARRRRENKDKTLPRLPGTVARLVSFTITARTARRVKTTTIKVLTTLLDADAYPAREIAALYAERWQIVMQSLKLSTPWCVSSVSRAPSGVVSRGSGPRGAWLVARERGVRGWSGACWQDGDVVGAVEAVLEPVVVAGELLESQGQDLNLVGVGAGLVAEFTDRGGVFAA